MESILASVKKDIGLTEECDHFDPDIIRYINSVFNILWGLGVGPPKCFKIQDMNDGWDSFIQGNDELESVKTYVSQKVKLMFDPPTNSTLLQALKDSIAEFEWRLNFTSEITTETKEET